MNKIIKELDDIIFKCSQIRNIINWDIDFTSYKKDNNDKIQILNYIRNFKNCKIKALLSNNSIKFDSISQEEEIFLNEVKIDYIVNNNEPSLEKKMNEINIKLKKNYDKAVKENNLSILLNDFFKYVECYSQCFDKNELKGNTVYEKAFNCFYMNFDYLIFNDIISSNFNELCKYKPLNVNDNKKISTINNRKILKELINIFKVEEDIISFHSDQFNSLDFFSKSDIRITLNYKTDNYNFIKGFLHEYGHALYLINISNNIELKCLQLPISKEFDEGTAKFFEKFLENKYFVQYLEKKLNFKLYRNVNWLSRITSNDVDYLKNCIARVIIEEKLLNKKISSKEFEKTWLEIVQQLFPNISYEQSIKMLLSDPHWFYGQFMYYHSYIMSFIYTSNLCNLFDIIMKNDNILEETYINKFKDILRKIHYYGKTKNICDVLKNEYDYIIDYNIYVYDYYVN